ncbi:deoxynucleoside triphosphate triphosphohydrolase SAMHD1 [Clupea harengus]|uniref:Deoxynucleoside triphosphate triphosphohydrolase SAMHD1 n=1 Tax=Clupea harengus TaxID=7950 RepID=A0A8M1KH98_CLUHA|nr:deoxynucleoside triphosphate triphosphohydrolase SAMHD1 [Clupea harengus]
MAAHGRPVSLSVCLSVCLSDCIFQEILNSSSAELEGARVILQNIICRRLYKFVGEIRPTPHVDVSQVKQREWAKEVASSKPSGEDVVLESEDFVVDVISFDYGMKDKNPMNYVHFYHKETTNKAKKIPKDQVSKLLPEKFAEQLIRVYCKRTDKPSLEDAKKYFEKWCMDNNFIQPQASRASDDSDDDDDKDEDGDEDEDEDEDE